MSLPMNDLKISAKVLPSCFFLFSIAISGNIILHHLSVVHFTSF